jgi:hypothetical protein
MEVLIRVQKSNIFKETGITMMEYTKFRQNFGLNHSKESDKSFDN